MQVEIWSDVVCPWCYIGKRRFERALASFEHADEVDVVWRSFQLDPTAPAGGQDGDALVAKYGMSPERAAQVRSDVTTTAAADGLEYHLGSERNPNTFDAHRLIHLAASKGLGDVAEERLFAANFTERANVGDPDTLVRLLADIGIDADETRAVLASDTYAAEVRHDLSEARALGATGVPFFVLDRAIGVSGAQSSDLLTDALRQAWAAGREIQPTSPSR
ncbi:MAG: DsbA family oxidoreductase [Frankia sp.]